jgi:hypothetical protein
MPFLRELLGPAWRALAHHLARLGRALDGLAQRLRDDITRAVEQAAADAARDAVRALLAEPGVSPGPTASVRGPPPWGGQLDDSFERAWAERPDEPWPADDLEGDLPEEEPPDPVAARLAGWRGALEVGCRAAAGWLRRHRARFPLLTAAAAGLLSALAWCAGGLADTTPPGAAVLGALGTS